MPVRAALNVVYALMVKGLDGKERQKFDTELHGWDDLNDRDNRALFRVGDDSGGEG
jgi:hypothetical protein